MKSHEEAMEIFNKFGIHTELVEPTVYRVLNDGEEVNIDTLKSKLKQGILLISSETKYKKRPDGYKDEYGQIYYILLGYDNNKIFWKYGDICRETKDIVASSFNYRSDYPDNIDTIWSAEELGRA